MAFIKLLLTKSWLMFIVVVAAAGLGGGAYAAWTASLHVEGTIQTGNVDVVWDMQDEREFVGVLDPQTGQVVVGRQQNETVFRG
ncbi:MAG: SipW-dependent-type signal peptide-containing protein [Chloroflexi bacterium]|nr:SipW-dependent-type signal peptide-containing protein [Chloroflexota bacterium]